MAPFVRNIPGSPIEPFGHPVSCFLIRLLQPPRYLLLPLGLLAALRLMFGGLPEVSVALVLMFMPTAVNVVAFSHDWQLDGKLAASAVLSSTLGSLVLLPALLLVLRY